MLKINNIFAAYGKVGVLWDVSLDVAQGEIVTLVGNNGSGKTTSLNAISGLVPLTSGIVEFMGRRIHGISAYRIVQLGISCVPEGGKPFPDMTVVENLEMGAYVYENWKNKEETLKQVFEIFPILKSRAKQLAKTLSGGERQMLAMGRSLMARPKLCMFDEPSYGLAPLMVSQLFKFIKELNGKGVTILVVEQNIRHALETADRGYVLENGRIVSEGRSEELLKDDHIKKAYLGI